MAITIPLFFAGDPLAAADLNTIDLRQPPICIARVGTAISIATAGAAAAMNTDVLDPLNWHDPVTNNTRITPTINGWYEVVTNFQFSGNTTGRRAAAARVNGTTVYYGTVMAATSASNVGCQTTTQLQLNGSTDYVEMFAFQDSGSTLTCGDTTSSRMTVRLLYAL